LASTFDGDVFPVVAFAAFDTSDLGGADLTAAFAAWTAAFAAWTAAFAAWPTAFAAEAPLFGSDLAEELVPAFAA
jgi:hypothetical protein